MGILSVKFKDCKAIKLFNMLFHTPYFPFVTAAVTAICSMTGWEILSIWYLCLCGAGIMLCCDDASPVLGIFLCMGICISIKHSPAAWGEDNGYLFSSGVLPVIIIAVAVFIIPLIYRLVTGVLSGRLKGDKFFTGLCLFCLALCLNGICVGKYYYMNFLYALGLSAIMIVVYVFMVGNIRPDERTYINLAYCFVALFAALTVQLIHAYITLGVVENGTIVRGKLRYGWGMYNQFGMYITMCVPAWYYLARKYKYGYFFLFGAVATFAVALLNMSRQGILMSAVLIFACSVWYLFASPKKDKIIGGSIFGAELLIVFILWLANREVAYDIFSNLFVALDTGSGRTSIWENSIKNWLNQPIFGMGIYILDAENWQIGYFGDVVSSSIPKMCHNTFFQLLSSCGLVGLLTYVYHRMQTVLSLAENPAPERLMVAAAACGILLTALLDNHLFYFLPNFAYAALLAFISVTERKETAHSAFRIRSGCLIGRY